MCALRLAVLSMLWVLCLTCHTALAQQNAPVLSLNDCIRLAQSAPSVLSIARQQEGIARYGFTQARAAFLPQSLVSNAFTYNSPLRGTHTPSFIGLNGIREYSSFVSVGIPLDISGQLRAGLSRADADRDAAAANFQITDRDLKRAVAIAYYRLLVARHLTRVQQDALDEARSFENRSRLLAQNGEVAQADIIKASAEVAFRQQALNGAELNAQLANHALASFWTTDVGGALLIVDVLDQPPEPPEKPPSGETPFLRRPELQFLSAQGAGLAADARRARADLLPLASTEFQYGVDATQWSLANRGYAAFIHLDVPLFDWLRNRGALRQAQLQVQQADLNRKIAERTFSREYQDALARAEQLYSQVALTEDQTRLSTDNLRLARLQYEGGEGSALDVISAQDQLARAKTNFYATKADYLNALADLEVASGK